MIPGFAQAMAEARCDSRCQGTGNAVYFAIETFGLKDQLFAVPYTVIFGAYQVINNALGVDQIDGYVDPSVSG